jgi:CheY-like chemotaxis protein
LIAEDDFEDMELIMEAFASINDNLHLLFFSEGRSAFDWLMACAPEQLPCLIILDYNMPEMTGAQVLKRLFSEEKFQGVPKVILSTATNKQFLNECMKYGADAYKIKPPTFGALVNIAREMLALCRIENPVS